MKRRLFPKAFLSVILLFSSFLQPGESYAWPTDASRTITTVFGDMRPRRFHAGLDIRTWGKTGYDLYAIEEGYIERIRTGSKGYGKALYLRLKNGNTAVYAHMQSFVPPLDSLVREFQVMAGSYTVDHYLPPEKYTFSKGELIGYSGDTGSISGPHLHFELRDPTGKPMNPALHQLEYRDSQAPVVNAIAFIPLSPDAEINGLPFPRLELPENPSKGQFTLKDTLHFFKDVGIAISLYDRVDQQPFHYGLFKVTLEFDGKKWFEVIFDGYDFSEDNQAVFHRDYALYRLNRDKYYRLFRSPYQNGDSFIKYSSDTAIPESEGLHTFRIVAEDYRGNRAEFTGQAIFHKDRLGTQELPATSHTTELVNKMLGENTFKWIDSESGMKILLRTDTVQSSLQMYYRTGGRLSFHPMNDRLFVSDHIPFSKLINGFPLVIRTGNFESQLPAPDGMLVVPGAAAEFVSSDSLLTLRTDGNTFYDTVFVRVTPISSPDLPEGVELMAGPYRIDPEYLPYRSSLEVIFAGSPLPHAGIYYLDRRKGKWQYLETRYQASEGYTTEILSGEVVALLLEYTPPLISNLVPENGGIYRTGELKSISFNVKDTFSGINGEKNVSVFLNGNPLIFEYNLYRQNALYEFIDTLKPGQYTLTITATDNAENEKTVTRAFQVVH